MSEEYQIVLIKKGDFNLIKQPKIKVDFSIPPWKRPIIPEPNKDITLKSCLVLTKNYNPTNKRFNCYFPENKFFLYQGEIKENVILIDKDENLEKALLKAWTQMFTPKEQIWKALILTTLNYTLFTLDLENIQNEELIRFKEQNQLQIKSLIPTNPLLERLREEYKSLIKYKKKNLI